jgi:5-bromo-4-chloroindolyl phosphate hydrolysis protein
MEQKDKGTSKVRTVLWVIASVLTVVSLGMLIWNYYTLEQTTVFMEKNAVQQAKNFSYIAREYKITKAVLDEANQKIVQLTQELAAGKIPVW